MATSATREVVRRPLDEESYAPPRDAFEFQLVAACTRVLRLAPVGIRDDLGALGLDGQGAEAAAAGAAGTLGRTLSGGELLAAGTLEQAARGLRRQPFAGAWDPLVAIQPFGDRMPLFAVHPAGGNVTSYTHLARAMGTDQPFFAFQAAGLEPALEPHASMESIAAHYVAVLRERFAPPYALSGWSYGGAVAFEMARQLRAAGDAVALVAVLDLAADDAAHLPDTAAVSLPLLIHAFRLDEAREELEALGLEGALPHIHDRAVERGKLPPDFGIDRLRRMHDLNVVNLEALRHYGFGRYDGRVTVFEAADRSEHLPAASDPTLGWGRWTDDVRTIQTPGTHFNFLGREHLPQLASLLARELAQAAP